MKDVKWYNDSAAKFVHEAVSRNLEPFIEQTFPGYELSHFGINRNDNTEEVVIKLHLNKLGQVKVIGSVNPVSNLLK